MTLSTDQHILPDVLEQYVSGALRHKEEELVIAHLAQCDRCLAQVDALWQGQPLGATLAEIPDLDQDAARRVERRLIKQIHRSNLAGQVIRLGTQGFIEVMLALTQPILRRGARPRNDGADDD